MTTTPIQKKSTRPSFSNKSKAKKSATFHSTRRTTIEDEDWDKRHSIDPGTAIPWEHNPLAVIRDFIDFKSTSQQQQEGNYFLSQYSYYCQ